MVHYNLPAFVPGDCSAFLAGVARSSGILKKGGKADLTQAARTVLRDWTTGKLPFYTDAPKEDNGTDFVSAGADEASLVKLYARGDEVALANMGTRREMRKARGLVRIVCGEAERRRIALDVPFVVEDGEGESEGGQGSVREEDDEDEENDEDGGEDEEGDDEDDLETREDWEGEADELPAPLTGKRKRKTAAAATSAARPNKKVTFAAGTQDHKERQQPRSTLKSAIKATSKPASKASKHTPRRAVPTEVTAVKAKTSVSKETGAYDFEQFFKP